jgi:drug/metabolite transporter (DMT)-like permease
MGVLDAGSATLGAIAGAYCPGELQTILNQLVIPVTLFGSYLLLYTRFKSYQLWGCLCIVVGACVASSDYYFNGQESVDVSVGVVSGESVSEDESASSSSGGVGGGMSVTVAIVVYFLSVLPSAFSNIYKEQQMKVHNMNEVHTSTFVSFYQLWIGFLFLPLLALPSLGGLTVDQMTSQMSDGFTCFLGTNPNDPDDDCSHSAYILLFYILLNFVYNVLLLVITKRGSAVLLVVSQALSLPLTNIAFTMKPLMGSDVEPLTITDLVGIILVCIGFLAYSGYGFANSFMVAQGPPGQVGALVTQYRG